ncbi:MAG: hypothetical protein COA79_12275 [Planctomycetota bacterium]|nr:MAG: hypothetical protein COA79_12275 [Planctomycetota bacterium]
MPRNIVEGLFKILGTEKEREMFLNIFHSQSPENFAVLLLDPDVLKLNFELFAWDLIFLARLKLFPIILVNIKNKDEEDLIKRLIALVKKSDGSLKRIPLETFKKSLNTKKLTDSVIKTIASGFQPILEIKKCPAFKFNSLDLAKLLLEQLHPRKILVVSNSGGLKLKSNALISYLEIDPDLERLNKNKEITHKVYSEIKKYKILLEQARAYEKKVHVQLVSSEGLLKELFTVQGSGTYLNLRNEVHFYNGYSKVDVLKLKKTIEKSFGFKLNENYTFAKNDIIFKNENSSAFAILKKVGSMYYLDKFVVDPGHQSEGWGNSLWREICSIDKPFFWRTKKTNPLQAWYFKKADGHQRVGDWYVFWIGVGESGRKKVIKFCEQRGDSFIR